MLKLQIQDRMRFLDKAKDMHVPIAAVPGATMVPVVDGDAVTMKPGIELKYVIRFKEAGEEFVWVFYEVKLEDSGRVDLKGTLWEELMTRHAQASSDDLPRMMVARHA